jgi:hypothetical protein
MKNVELNRSVSGSISMKTNPWSVKSTEIIIFFDGIVIRIRGDTAARSAVYCPQ